MIVQCCVCKRVRSRYNGWNPPLGHELHKIANGYPVSHSYCPECAEMAKADIRSTKDTKYPYASISAVLKGITERINDRNDTLFNVFMFEEFDAIQKAAHILGALSNTKED